MTMLSVEIPTGYAYEQFDGLKLIRTGIVPELKEVDATQNGQTIWYFNHIPKDVRCFEHTVKIVEISFIFGPSLLVFYLPRPGHFSLNSDWVFMSINISFINRVSHVMILEGKP